MAPIVRRRPARKLSERVPSFFYRKNKPVTPTEKKNETNGLKILRILMIDRKCQVLDLLRRR